MVEQTTANANDSNNMDNKNDDHVALEIERQENELRLNDADLLVESTIKLSDSGNDKAPGLTESNNVDGAITTMAPKYDFVPLRMGGNGRTHMASEGSKSFFVEYGGNITIDDLKKLTTFFYEKAFQDKTLDQFIQSHNDPHAKRFALWIHQKLTGSQVWDQERYKRSLKPVKVANNIDHVVHDRSSAHVAAWYSKKRPSHEVGRHFTLEECRVWMRLHFWSLRESGIMEKNPGFADYYIRFIGHFVRVYENSAPAFARDSLRWSADPQNVQTYIHENDRVMQDVLGLTDSEAEAQIPTDELYDFTWPYNTTR